MTSADQILTRLIAELARPLLGRPTITYYARHVLQAARSHQNGYEINGTGSVDRLLKHLEEHHDH